MLRTSTRQASVLDPAIAGSTPTLGLPIGMSLWDSSPFFFSAADADPAELPSTNTLTLGALGTGKSANIKARILRQLTLNRRQTVVLDAQGEDGVGEWADICDALNITPLRMDPDSDLRINVLDKVIPRSKRESLLVALAETAAGKPGAPADALTPEQQDVIRDALVALPEGSHLGDLVALLGQWAEQTDTRRGVHAERPYVALKRYTIGDLAGMFDGPTQNMPELADPLIVVDFSRLDRNSPALPAVMAVFGVWLEHAWIRPDDVWRTLVIEEAWHLLRSPETAHLFQRLLKYSRRLHLSIDAVMHTLSDMPTEQAQDLARLAGTCIVHQLPLAEAKLAAKAFGLPDWTVKEITNLGVGEALWKVGRTITIVSCVLSAIEEQLVATTKGRTRLHTSDEDGDTVTEHDREDWWSIADAVMQTPEAAQPPTESAPPSPTAAPDTPNATAVRPHRRRIGAVAVIVALVGAVAWANNLPSETERAAAQEQAAEDERKNRADYRADPHPGDYMNAWAEKLAAGAKGTCSTPYYETSRDSRQIGTTDSVLDVRYQDGLWCAQILSRKDTEHLQVEITPHGEDDWIKANGDGRKTTGAMLRGARCIDARATVPNQASRMVSVEVTNICADDTDRDELDRESQQVD